MRWLRAGRAWPQSTMVWNLRTSGAVLVLAAAAACSVDGLDNSLGLLPPMGWRNWWSWGGDVDQAKMEFAFTKMTERKRRAVGRSGLASFADLGYVRAGLDDAWQACGTGVNGSFHDAEGRPLVDQQKFPDMAAMVRFGTSRGLLPGWYLNNCKCQESMLTDAVFVDLTMQKTVDAMVAMNFSGVKFDGCGPARNLTRWAELINASGHPLLIEDCHWGQTVPTGVPQSMPQLRYEPCDPNSAAQTGFHYDSRTKTVAKTGLGSSASGCVQANTAAGQKALLLAPCSPDRTPGQRWDFNVSGETGDFSELIAATDPGSCMDMFCGPCGPGKPIQLHSCHSGANQLWSFTNGTIRSQRVGADGVAYCASSTTPESDGVGVSPADDGYCSGLDMPSECPYNVYRSSGDVINSFERVYHNVRGVSTNTSSCSCT